MSKFQKLSSAVCIFMLMSMTVLLLSITPASGSTAPTYTLFPNTINSSGVSDILFDSGTNTLYLGTNSGAISSVNTSTNQIESTIATSSGLYQMLLDQATNTIYALTYSGLITPVDLTTGKTGTTIQASSGIQATVLDQATNTIYAASYSGLITPVDLTTGKTGTTIQASSGIQSLTFDQATNTIYAGSFFGSLTSIDVATGKVVNIPTGLSSGGLAAFDPVVDAVYTVSRTSSGTSSFNVINPLTGAKEDSLSLLSSSGLYARLIFVADKQNASSYNAYIYFDTEGIGILETIRVSLPLPPTTTTSTTTTLPPTTTTSTTTTTVVTKTTPPKRKVFKAKVKVKSKEKIYKKPVVKVIKSATTIHTGEPWSGSGIYLATLALLGLVLAGFGFRKAKIIR